MDSIKFEQKKNEIVIIIPNERLKFVAENSDDVALEVVDLKSFCGAILFQLKNNNNEHTGLTGLEKLIDSAIIEIFESAHESVKSSIK